MIKRTVEVYRKGFCPESSELSRETEELGITEKYTISVSKLYIIELDEDNSGFEPGEQVRAICSEILTDPVVEEYSMEKRNMQGFSVEVYFTDGVLDIAGVRALEAAGYAGLDRGVENISSGKRYIINSDSDIDTEACRHIARELLYNKVIEEAVYASF